MLPRKAPQKSGPRTMDGTPEVDHRNKRRNLPLLEKTGPGGMGRLAEPRAPDSRLGKIEEPYQKNRNDAMGENERVEEGGPQAENSLHCRWEGCSFVGKTVGGRNQHERKIHEVMKTEACEKCGRTFKEGQKTNHREAWTGKPPPPPRCLPFLPTETRSQRPEIANGSMQRQETRCDRATTSEAATPAQGQER